MAEKRLLEKLREEYLAANSEKRSEAIADFCAFSETWLADQSPTGVSYTVDGLMLRFANGDSFVLVSAPDSDMSGAAVSVTGMSKLNARATPERAADFPITGR